MKRRTVELCMESVQTCRLVLPLSLCRRFPSMNCQSQTMLRDEWQWFERVSCFDFFLFSVFSLQIEPNFVIKNFSRDLLLGFWLFHPRERKQRRWNLFSVACFTYYGPAQHVTRPCSRSRAPFSLRFGPLVPLHDFNL